MQLENKNILVIGMGKTGIATANFLIQKRALVTLIDSRSRKELGKTICLLNSEVRLLFDCSVLPASSDLIVLSPGVDIRAPFLAIAHKEGVEIISEIELASRCTQTPIIAVTGTNGKSTVTTLIGKVLEQAGKNVAVGGNLGVPFIGLLDKEPVDYFVLEISTFQLEGIKTFRPYIAMILNITPDHLDRHKTFEEYAALKGKISAFQTSEDILILNNDDENVMKQRINSKAKKVYFSVLNEVSEGVYLENNLISTCFSQIKKSLFSINELNPAMQCQVENLLGTIAVASIIKATARDVLKVATEFTGLAHRIEWVRTVRGIDFINDSKGTNVGSVNKSLATFTKPVILIAGGKDKGADFLPLKEVLKKKVKHLVLMGETKNNFRKILNGSFSYEDAESMEDAVKRAMKKAQAGDVVLLSPGCSSFDMFKDYSERGNQFKEIVSRL